MTPLRQPMLEDMQLKGLAPTTQQAYLRHVQNLKDRYIPLPPRTLTLSVGLRDGDSSQDCQTYVLSCST